MNQQLGFTYETFEANIHTPINSKKKKKKKKNLIVKFYAFLLFFKTGEIRVIFHFKQSMQHTILHFN